MGISLKNMQFKISHKLALGFGILILLVVILGLYSLSTTNALAQLTHKLYRHPLAVSNGMRDIEIGITKMHRSMKDVALAKNNEQIKLAAEAVDTYEQEVFKHFELVKERFLGDPTQVNEALEAFTNWKIIRNEVIALMREGNREEAAHITKNKGAHHVKDMASKIGGLLDFANEKADSFYTNAQAKRRQVQVATTSIISIIAGISCAVAVIVGRMIVKPLQRCRNLAHALAQGDLSQRLNITASDEIGDLAKALDKCCEDLGQMVESIKGTSTQLGQSATELSNTSTQMTQNADELSNTSSVVASSSEEMSSNMNSMAASSEQMSANAQSVATAIEEMTSSIDEVSRNAAEAATVAEEATGLVETSNQNIGNLGEAADQIGKVIEVIQDIAEQTNLLALNATIEAARAGEAGKGFAVVASEVKDLARQTSDATGDIANRIGAIQSNTTSTIESMANISDVIAKVNDVSRSIASAVEEQSVTTREIASNTAQTASASGNVANGINETASATKEITQNISNVDQAAKGAAQGATDIQTASQQLTHLSTTLQDLVGQFKV